MNCSLPGSSVHEILQARILEWLVISFSQRDLPNPGNEPRSPTLQADSLPAELPGKPRCFLFPFFRCFLTSYLFLLMVICNNVLGLRTSPVAQLVKNPPAMQVAWVRSLGWEDPMEKGMATHSSILAWRISWTKEPGGL